MKIFVCHNERTKKCEAQWKGLTQILASKFGLEPSQLLVELKATDAEGNSIWIDLEDEDDLSEGCMVRLTECDVR